MIRNKYLLATLLAAATFTAHATDWDTTFDSVSSIKEDGTNTTFTGILVDGTATTFTFPHTTNATGDRCNRKFDLMLTDPGIYTLVVSLHSETVSGPGGIPQVVTRFVSCTLTRKP